MRIHQLRVALAVVEELVAVADVNDAPIAAVAPRQVDLVRHGGAARQGERAGVVAVEHRRQACAICGGQLGQVGEQLADVGDLVGRARLGDLALVLLVLDRIAHEGDQGFVGKGIDKTQPLVLQAQRVVDGELVGQGLEGGLEVRPGLFAPRDLVGGETLDVVVLAVAVLVEAVIVVVVDDLVAVLLDVLLANTVIGGGILEQEGIGKIGQVMAQALEGTGGLAAAGEPDMPLVHQHQAEHPARRWQLEVAALVVEQAAGGFHHQLDAPGALAVQSIDQRSELAPVLVDQVDARRGKDDLQFVKGLHAADVVDVLQDVQVHQQRLAAAGRHPVGEHVAARAGGLVAQLAHQTFGEVEREDLVIAQPHRAAHQQVVALQPAGNGLARPALEAGLRLGAVGFHRLLVGGVVAFAGRRQAAQEFALEAVVELEFHVSSSPRPGRNRWASAACRARRPCAGRPSGSAPDAGCAGCRRRWHSSARWR